MKRSDAEYALATCLVYLREIHKTGQAGCLFDLADKIVMVDEMLDMPTDNRLAGIIKNYKGEYVITKHRRS